MMMVGIDVGGTFTDVYAYDPKAGTYRVHKLPSTPANPMIAMVQGLREMGIRGSNLKVFAHGTTVTTNAVIQKIGAKTGLITTRGFRDVLQLRRTNRADVYNLQWNPPPELVPRRLRQEVSERIDAEGHILETVGLSEVRAVAECLLSEGIESLAIAFLHSYVNPSNERAARDYIRREFPDLPVCVSSDVLPEWREFERTSTTVVNAYLTPILSRYLDQLEKEMSQDGYTNAIFVMLSNGGLTTADVAREIPAYTLASGPAGGVVAEKSVSLLYGEPNVVGLDMGGTSADVSLISDGEVSLTSEQQVEFGTPVRLPAVEVTSIGAGGGSIAWIDVGGGLHVGPRSAGAEPGPACYGRGGTEPTVTDANVVLGRLNPKFLLGGAMTVHSEKAWESISGIADSLSLPVETTAWGILEIAVQNMVNAIRQMTVQRGIDPREYVLFGYGGAGPLHAAQVAEELEMPKVIIPSHPGVTSAQGLLMTDIRHDFCRTYVSELAEAESVLLEREFAELESKARERLAKEGVADCDTTLVRGLDLRYLGQTHELTVELEGCSGEVSKSVIEQKFRSRHNKEFGFVRDIGFAIQVVNLRLKAIGTLPKVSCGDGTSNQLTDWVETTTRQVIFQRDTRRVDTPIFDKDRIPVGEEHPGPAIIEQFDSTTVVLPGQTVVLSPRGDLIIHTSAMHKR